MITEVLCLMDGQEAEKIARAARIIQKGGLVAFPTETVYGLGWRMLFMRRLPQRFTRRKAVRQIIR